MSWEFTITDENRAELLGLLRDAPAGWRVTLERPAHTDLQRKKFNAMCGDLAKQVLWDGERLTATEWKHWLTAAWEQQKMVRGDARGTIVFVGTGLGRRGRADVADLIELAYCFGAEREVKWSKEAHYTTEGTNT